MFACAYFTTVPKSQMSQRERWNHPIGWPTYDGAAVKTDWQTARWHPLKRESMSNLTFW